MARRLYFLLFSGCEGLAVAGAQQAFHEANDFGGDYEIRNRGIETEIVTEKDYVFLLGYTIERCVAPCIDLALHLIERAAGLLKSPELTVDAVAVQCGFSDARRLRRIWKQAYGTSPKGS